MIVLCEKEYMFSDVNTMLTVQASIVESLEILGLKYRIERGSIYGTGTPKWTVIIGK